MFLKAVSKVIFFVIPNFAAVIPSGDWESFK